MTRHGSGGTCGQELLTNLRWLVTAGCEVRIDAHDFTNKTEFQVSLYLDTKEIFFYGELQECLARARAQFERGEITP